MPADASPATASPATTETATGRKSGSTMPSAAAGNSAPLASTADRNAGPSPGRGATSVTARNTATIVGSRQSRPMVTQVRGRRNSFDSSTAIIGAPRGRPGPNPGR